MFMKKLVFLVIVATYASAVDACPEKCIAAKTKTTTPKTVYVTKTVEGKSPITDAKATSTASATTGNQSIIIQSTPVKPVVIKLTRTIVKRKIVKKTKTILVYTPNRLLLLGGATKTNLDIEFDCCDLVIKRRYEPDFGLQYIRDFGPLSASMAATGNHSMYLGLGINW